MSKYRAPAWLPGHAGPFFVELLEQLHEAMYANDSCSFNKCALEDTFKASAFFRNVQSLCTEDEYHWFWAVIFDTTRGGKMVLALPWAQDWDQRDGVRSDRHSAVYTRGEVSQLEIEEIIAHLIDLWKAREASIHRARAMN